MARVHLTSDALLDLARLTPTMRRRVEGLFARLQAWPTVSGARPLRRELAGRYRLRTGDHRVQFRVDGAEIIVEKIGHRDGFYEE